MALPANEVKKAVKILCALLEESPDTVRYHSNVDSKKHTEFKNAILYCGKVQDGWESVSINVTKFDSVQFEFWERKKHEVNNSSFISLENGILSLGFF